MQVGLGIKSSILAFALSACVPFVSPAPTLLPADRPLMPEAPGERSEKSLELSEYYARVERGLLVQGLLRMDGGGPDVPFTKSNLVDNFIQIGLFEEYTTIGNQIVAQKKAGKLHRWEQPVLMQIEFGETVPTDQRARDRADVVHYTKRLARLSGLPMRQVTTDANFHVFFVNEDDRPSLRARLLEIIPRASTAELNAAINMDRSSYCLVIASTEGDSNLFSKAAVIIRAEHPHLMRLSCIHEELAQGLGLSNDSPAARPSIFNDDEEFGLLTTHDEMLLRILYDPRLTAGMSAQEARAQAEIVASDLLGGES